MECASKYIKRQKARMVFLIYCVIAYVLQRNIYIRMLRYAQSILGRIKNNLLHVDVPGKDT